MATTAQIRKARIDRPPTNVVGVEETTSPLYKINQMIEIITTTQSGIHNFAAAIIFSRDCVNNRYTDARIKPPSEPTAAASVGVASPNKIVPSTARIMTDSGKNDVSNILKTSSLTKFSVPYKTPRNARPTPNTYQNAGGVGSRTIGERAADLSAFAVFAAALSAASLNFAGSVPGGSCTPPRAAGSLGASLGGSAKPPVDSIASTAPICCSPLTSWTSLGLVSAFQVKPMMTTNTTNGASVMPSCLSRNLVVTSAFCLPLSARNSDGSARVPTESLTC